jgi:WD40 repeat protein
MKKKIYILIAFLLATFNIFAAEIVTPYKQLVADDAVNDIVVRDGLVVAGTEHGSLIRFELASGKAQTLLTLPKIKDFMGDMMNDKIFTVDYIEGRYLIHSDSGEGGFSDIYLFEEGKLKKLIGADSRLAIIKARFIDKDHILFADLGSVLYLYDIPKKKIIFSKAVSGSKFSDFALRKSRKQVVVGGESGVLRVVDVKSAKVLRKIEKLHLDNVFSVAFSADIISAGGQDRRGSYYDLKSGRGDYIKGKFLVYATAISPKGKYIAYALEPDNSITVFERDGMHKRYLLKGQKSILTAIRFVDENTLVSSSHDDTIMVWKLKK